MPPEGGEAPFIVFKGLTKRFGGVTALDQVSFSIARGQCHALCGENGAGKSTLGKILAGYHLADSGEIVIEGRPALCRTPCEALARGIAMVHQELACCENLTVADNLCLDDLPRRGPFVDRRRLRERARELLAAVHAEELDVDRPAGELSAGRLQLLQIAGAVRRGARVIVFDEPTSSLSRGEAETLFNLVAKLKARGVTCLYVSHRMEEILGLCDAVTVLRDGRHVETKPRGAWSYDSLVGAMIGRRLAEYFPAHVERPPGEECLRVEGFSSPGRFRGICLSLRAGEVVGMAGLVGAGRTELACALVGLDRKAAGRMMLFGREVHIDSPRAALRLGLGMVPEDRKRHGLAPLMSARANITLPFLSRLADWGWVRRGAERNLAREYFERLRVFPREPEFPAAGMSGGNQQKLVLARWLAARCKVLLLDEPTRGVDVGAKSEIHRLIEQLACDGHAILLISSELPELVNLASRILVMRDGRLVGETPGGKADQDELLRMMMGAGEAKTPPRHRSSEAEGRR